MPRNAMPDTARVDVLTSRGNQASRTINPDIPKHVATAIGSFGEDITYDEMPDDKTKKKVALAYASARREAIAQLKQFDRDEVMLVVSTRSGEARGLLQELLSEE